MTLHEIPLERRTLHGHFSRDLAPVLTVDSGDSIAFVTPNVRSSSNARPSRVVSFTPPGLNGVPSRSRRRLLPFSQKKFDGPRNERVAPGTGPSTKAKPTTPKQPPIPGASCVRTGRNR